MFLTLSISSNVNFILSCGTTIKYTELVYLLQDILIKKCSTRKYTYTNYDLIKMFLKYACRYLIDASPKNYFTIIDGIMNNVMTPVERKLCKMIQLLIRQVCLVTCFHGQLSPVSSRLVTPRTLLRQCHRPVIAVAHQSRSHRT